jgi:N-acetyltransferase 10
MFTPGMNSRCLVLDDELNVLPISKHIHNIQPIDSAAANADEDKLDGTAAPILTKHDSELIELQKELADEKPIGALINMAKTVDQARALLTFVEAISEKTLRSTVALTAGRGRGKSAALGMSLASAVAYGYSNIFVTAPSPENLATVFEFIFKAFDALHYQEHVDYEAVQSTNPDFNRAIIRVNIFREHRQTIQYISPTDSHRLGQAEILAIDEAAAIPLPLVKKLLGPYLVFMSSTVNGYEGTGRGLALKLIQKLREQQGSAIRETSSAAAKDVKGADKKKGDRKVHEDRWKAAAKAASIGAGGISGAGGRVLREIELEIPIRYASGDPVEKWLNELLCLDVAKTGQRTISKCPPPKDCELYYVDRDALFR